MKSYRADLILMFITLIWASTFSLIKNILGDVTPFLFVFLRFGLATLLFLIIINRKIKIREGKTLPHSVILGLLYAAGFCLQIFGLQFTTSSKSAFITGTLVVWAPVFQMVTEKKLINIWQLTGVIFAGVGLFILSSPEGGVFNIGDVLTLAGAMLFGVYVVLVGNYSKVSDLNGLVFVQFLMTSLISLPFVFLFEKFTFSLNSNVYLIIFYTAIFAAIICTYLQTKFQKETTPTRAGIIYTFESVFAALIALIFFKEIIGLNVIFGGILIIFGLLFAELSDFFIKLTFNRK